MSLTEVKASYFYPDGETKESDDSAKNIKSEHFTHLFCAFANVDADTHKVFVSEKHQEIFSGFSKTVKNRNHDVKTLLSIGGRNAVSSVFKSMASTFSNRKAFIDSSISIARNMGFNGLDLAWEYPNGKKEMENFKILLEEWHSAIQLLDTTDETCLLLTATVYYLPEYNYVPYHVEEMVKSLDWVNIMAYDFYGSSTVIRPPAALYDPENPKAPSGHFSLKQWIDAGLPRKKAVFGFPYVGWKWTVESSHDPINTISNFTKTSADSSINYDQIKSFIVDKKANTFYDAMVVGDNCYKDSTVIAYDDTATVVTKVRNAKLSGLLGYFSWNVGADYNSALSLAASDAWNVDWDA